TTEPVPAEVATGEQPEVTAGALDEVAPGEADAVLVQQAQIGVDKTNSAGGETVLDRGVVQPGDSFDYMIQATCSSIDEDCVDLTVVDTFPSDWIVQEGTIP